MPFLGSLPHIFKLEEYLREAWHPPVGKIAVMPKTATYDTVPCFAALGILAGLAPLVVAVGGCMWTVKRTSGRRDRAIGNSVSVLGSALTAGQVIFDMIAIWSSV